MKTADLCDAFEETEPCAVQFLGFGKLRSFYGVVRTVQCNRDISQIRAMVNLPGSANVLVIDNKGLLDCAVFGDVMATISLRNGWAGIIVNGAIRDSTEINMMDIGVKALGTFPRRAEVCGAGKIDVPVSFGDITIDPGRYIVVDEDGIVLLPKGLTIDNVK